MKTPTETPSAAESAHTPTPWRVFPPIGEGDFAVMSERVNAGGNFYVATLPNGSHAEAKGNAALICRAVNSHAELVAALREALTWAETYRRELAIEAKDGGPLCESIRRANAALAKAAT